jgi:hypothetical protein
MAPAILPATARPVMFGFGLLMGVYIHRDTRIGRFGEVEF